jgi:hypothetical protein
MNRENQVVGLLGLTASAILERPIEYGIKMSADNILLIVEHMGKVRVFDVNFSDISSHDAWEYPLTIARYEALRDYIVANQHNWEVWSGKAAEAAENACRRHMRSSIVEYGFTNLITRFDSPNTGSDA